MYRKTTPFTPISASKLDETSPLASGVPRLELVDFIPGQSKDIAPYRCAGCNSLFKRLSAYNIHNGYHRKKRKCPSDIDLAKLNLRKTLYIANGNKYDCWEVIPAVQPTGIKDELLDEIEKAAFPDFTK